MRLDSYVETVVFIFYILNLNESILQILMNQLLVSLMTRRDAETPPSDQWLFTRGRGFLMSDVIISPRALTTSRAGHHLSRPTPRSLQHFFKCPKPSQKQQRSSSFCVIASAFLVLTHFKLCGPLYNGFASLLKMFLWPCSCPPRVISWVFLLVWKTHSKYLDHHPMSNVIISHHGS